jgi:CubicO group peptidase (beta-lactamase class C family)
VLFKQELLDFVFSCAFMVLVTFVIAPKVTASETASYQGLQQDKFMKTWFLLGPIPVSVDPEPNEEAQKKAFALDFLAEQGGETAIHPAPGLAHKIDGEEYTWQLAHAEDDVVDLVKVYGIKEFVVAYAWAEIDVPEATTALLGIGSDDGVKVWLNGELVHENWIGRAVNKDDDLVPATFQKGKNQLLLKVQNQEFDWGFACRVLGSASLTEKLVSSAGRGDLDNMELLLSHGADVNATIDPGLTALHSAKIHGREDTVKFLLEKGADPNIEMPPKRELADAVFERVIKGDSPGAAVLIAKDGEILYQKGFGFASLEHHVPITPETKFRIGSITKQFTAAAVLKLQEDGLLSVKDPLSKFIPDYPRGDEVTIHHLLTHTSGIHSYTGKPDFMKTVTVETKPEDLIESFKNDEFDFDPGEKWLYNNSGYFLLGYIIQEVSGESYGDYLKNHFFDPLDMKDTGVHHWSLILEHEATGYSYQNGKFKKALDWDMSRAGGAGALYSTVGDLYRWNEAVFNGKVLGESSLEAAFTPVTLNDGSKANAMGFGYGYGWVLLEIRGMKEIGHGGGLNGFSTYLGRYPEQKVTVAVLTNCVPPPPGLSAEDGAHEIAEIYLWDQMEVRESFAVDATVDPSLYDDYVGRYGYPEGAILIVTKEGDRLFAQLTGQPKFGIFPRSETEFFWKVVDAQVTFVRNEEGEVTHAIHRQGGREFEAPKLKDEAPVDVDPAVYDAYVGQYEFKNIGTLTVSKEEDRLFVQMTGQPKVEIFPRSETEFFLKIVNAQITFVKNDEREVVKAILNQGGMEIEAPKIK